MAPHHPWLQFFFSVLRAFLIRALWMFTFCFRLHKGEGTLPKLTAIIQCLELCLTCGKLLVENNRQDGWVALLHPIPTSQSQQIL